MWPVCSPGSRSWRTLSRTGLLEWSEKKQMGRPPETKLCGEIAGLASS